MHLSGQQMLLGRQRAASANSRESYNAVRTSNIRYITNMYHIDSFNTVTAVT